MIESHSPFITPNQLTLAIAGSNGCHEGLATNPEEEELILIWLLNWTELHVLQSTMVIKLRILSAFCLIINI